MITNYKIKLLAFLITILMLLTQCNGKLPGADARKYPADPEERIKKNLAEGKGFKLFDSDSSKQGGVFEFASSNDLWKASLDVIDFMPLASVNYSGGIIVTDWYSSDQNQNESIKISIRFLTNEIRSDALEIKVFKKNCTNNFQNCKIVPSEGVLVAELKREILKKATLYKTEKAKEKK